LGKTYKNREENARETNHDLVKVFFDTTQYSPVTLFEQYLFDGLFQNSFNQRVQ
jgi:hypothetical protein